MNRPTSETMISSARTAGRDVADQLFAELGPDAAATKEQAAEIFARAMTTLSGGIRLSLQRWGWAGDVHMFQAALTVAVGAFAERCRALGWKVRAMNDNGGSVH